MRETPVPLKSHLTLWICAGLVATASGARAGDWPQFRGPNAAGIAASDKRLPERIDPARDTLWKTPLAPGHSSPVVVGNQIYVTALRGKKLLTAALNLGNGRLLWEREAPYETLEEHHRRSSPAVASVAADAEHVVSFFGSSGLLCHTPEGRELWRRRMGPFHDPQGAASSPIIVDDKVVMVRDQDTGSHIAAFDLRTGSEVWRTKRPNFRRNYGTPVVWDNNERRQIVTAGSAMVTGYDLTTGRLEWHVIGCARVVSATPVVGADGRLYVVNAAGGGDLRGQHYPPFKDILSRSDANHNGQLEKKEIPAGPIAGYLDQFDRDASGALDEDEYESIREIYRSVRHVAMAIRPGPVGDATDTHVVWTQDRMIPRNASPVVHRGILFMVKDGGILTSLDLKDGSVLKSERLEKATGSYFASPVIGDGRVFLMSERGKLSIVTAEGEWRQTGAADFDEETLATPAIMDGRILIRTKTNLHCLGIR